jgi:hypothetical protein
MRLFYVDVLVSFSEEPLTRFKGRPASLNNTVFRGDSLARYKLTADSEEYISNIFPSWHEMEAARSSKNIDKLLADYTASYPRR